MPPDFALNRFSLDAVNLRTMRASEVVSGYAAHSKLLPHEKTALDRIAKKCRGQPILDIGVGGGRTVEALLGISQDYLGVDYSPEMIDACERRYPSVRFALADARNMEQVANDSIGLAVFSCNGISMVGHEDRQQILREVARVLRPGGMFVFTTYNLRSPEATAGFRWPEFQFSAHPGRMLIRTARFIRDSIASYRNRLKHLPQELRTADYAIINDACHNHGVMLYYITAAEQRKQLRDAGFEARSEVFDRDGNPMTDDGVLDSMAFVARKAG